jgi:hypothetical protein
VLGSSDNTLDQKLDGDDHKLYARAYISFSGLLVSFSSFRLLSADIESLNAATKLARNVSSSMAYQDIPAQEYHCTSTFTSFLASLLIAVVAIVSCARTYFIFVHCSQLDFPPLDSPRLSLEPANENGVLPMNTQSV